MKILISSNSYWNLYNFRYDLIHELRKNEHNVYLLSPIDEYTKKFAEMGCVCLNLRMKSNKIAIFSDLKLLINYFKIFFFEKPDYFLAFTIKPNVYGSIITRILGIKTINTITGLGTTFIKNTYLKNIVIFLYKESLKRSLKVFFHNNEDSSLFIKLNIVNKIQIEVIPGSGVNINKYKYIPLIKRNKENLVFLYLGRLRWDKGIKELIETIILVKKKYKKIKFKFLGQIEKNNPEYVNTKQLNKWIKADIIEYLGESKDVRNHIANADCIILLSYREGLPKSLLEGSAMGRPLIATNVPGCKHVVIDTVNGYLCNLKDIQDTYQKILHFINLDFKKKSNMGLQGHLLTNKKFVNSIVINKYLRIFNGIK